MAETLRLAPRPTSRHAAGAWVHQDDRVAACILLVQPAEKWNVRARALQVALRCHGRRLHRGVRLTDARRHGEACRPTAAESPALAWRRV